MSSSFERFGPQNPIKVVYVIGSLEVGGAEGQLLQLLQNIDRNRFEPSLVLFNRVTIDRANGMATHVYDLHLSSKRNSEWHIKGGKLAAAIFRLSCYLMREQPHIVHAILPTSNIIAAAATMLVSKPIMVGSRRSLVDGYRTTKLLALVDQQATRRCDFMIGNSQAILKELVELDGFSADRVALIPNGVDTEKFRPGERGERYRRGWREDHVVFGIVANFIPYKRHIDFVLAAEQIAKANSHARFVMVGEDRGTLASLRDEVARRCLEPLFTIIPGSNEPEHLYPAMDAYICTSDTEGFSNVLLEAAASGLPIVATRVGGNPEIVANDYNGLLVERRSPESIANAALILASNWQMREQMGARSRERVLTKFSVRNMVNRYETLYEKLLNNSGTFRNVAAVEV